MKNFEYLSVASVDSVLQEQSNQQHVIHEFKIRDFELQNLLPDQIFRIVLQPEDRPTENTSHNYSAVRDSNLEFFVRLIHLSMVCV